MKDRLSLENSLYLLAFLLALGLRLYNLGGAPLSDAEARWALQALDVARGQAPLAMGPQPGYVLLSGLLFWLAGASSFAARLLPALAGALLVWLPYLLRGVFLPAGQARGAAWLSTGRLAGLILAFGLALEPGLAALSRQAGSGLPALSLGLLSLALAWAGRPILAGASAGLALLMGADIFHGALVLALAWAGAALFRRFGRAGAPAASQAGPPSGDGGGAAVYPLAREAQPSLPDPEAAAEATASAAPLPWPGPYAAPALAPAAALPFPAGRVFWTRFLVSAAAALLLAGSLLLRFPSGLSAWGGSLAAYLAGWGPGALEAEGYLPVLRLLAALPFYTPLALLFGLLGLVGAWLRPGWFGPWSAWVRRLGLLFLAALLLAALYPGRRMDHLLWALVPLWALAGFSIARLLQPAPRPEAAAPSLWVSQALLLFVLFALFFLNLAGLTLAPAGTQTYTLRLGVMIGVLALGLLTTVLVGLGWSWEAALRGLVTGLALGLGAATLSAAWGAAQLHPAEQLSNLYARQELWSPGPESASPDLLLETVQDLAEWETGWHTDIDILLAVDSPSLRWALREFPQVSQAPSGSAPRAAAGSPAVIVTTELAEEPSLEAAYRGQDFAWRLIPTWTGALPDDLFRWWAFRQAPARIERFILWARADLFPGEESGAGRPGSFEP